MSPHEGGNDMNDHFYSPSALPLMQSLLATLADIDFAHECELQRLATGSGDPALKGRVRAQLEASHRARRAPYVQQLGVLEARIEPACRT
jgi:hypothetical protein